MGTSYDPPEEVKESSSERMMRIFEQEMSLGPDLGSHLPGFIAEGLAQLRRAPEGTFDNEPPVKQEASEGEETKEVSKKSDGRIQG